jgi:hypothetical protein
MERPWDWISTDPDLRCLYQRKDLYKSECFDEFLDNQRQKDYPRANFDAGGCGEFSEWSICTPPTIRISR